MIDNWKQFLANQGATIDDSRVIDFGDEKTEKKAALGDHILCDLSHYGLIQGFGEEASDFLQNQFCNDVQFVTDTHSQLNAYCNPKGRVLAFFRLFQINNLYYLRLPQELLADTLNRLRMFVLMTKVTLEDASDNFVKIGYSGPEADKKLAKLIDSVPDSVDAVTQTNNVTVIRVSNSPARFEIIGSVEDIKAIWETLGKEATPVGSGSWNLLDIQDAIPEVLPETKEAFVPQMINLEGINALSFKKGCYPGQEIVARMHYLGKLKRHMFLAHTESDDIPKPGDSLFSGNIDNKQQSGQGAGKIVRAEVNPDGGINILAVIEIASKEKGDLHLVSAKGPTLNIKTLPYTVNESK